MGDAAGAVILHCMLFPKRGSSKTANCCTENTNCGLDIIAQFHMQPKQPI